MPTTVAESQSPKRTQGKAIALGIATVIAFFALSGLFGSCAEIDEPSPNVATTSKVPTATEDRPANGQAVADAVAALERQRQVEQVELERQRAIKEAHDARLKAAGVYIPPEPEPEPEFIEYIVLAGEWPALIAEKNGVTLASLLDANGLNADSIIHPGDALRIPIGTDDAAEVDSLTSAEVTPPLSLPSSSTPVAAPVDQGYWHEHCARIRRDGGCDRRFRPIHYANHHHPSSYPHHNQGEHEID